MPMPYPRQEPLTGDDRNARLLDDEEVDVLVAQAEADEEDEEEDEDEDEDEEA